MSATTASTISARLSQETPFSCPRLAWVPSEELLQDSRGMPCMVPCFRASSIAVPQQHYLLVMTCRAATAGGLQPRMVWRVQASSDKLVNEEQAKLRFNSLESAAGWASLNDHQVSAALGRTAR